MTERELHRLLVLAVLGAAAATAAAVTLVTAPYGRHARPGFGPTLPSRIGWLLMESPACLGFAAFFALGDHRGEAAPIVLFLLWQAHYLNRALFHPFRMRAGSRRMPLLVALLGFGFNVLNAWLNARQISHFGDYPAAWLADPRFAAGALLFGAGMALNRHADGVLFRLRGPGESHYAVPMGGAYRWVSCPNYLGELVEWLGWAVATWSLAGLAFALYSAANLVPRAMAHHRWYRRTFPGYPAERRAIIPFLL